MQLKCSFSIIIVSNGHHFTTDCLHTVQMLIFYHHHFQLSSLCNWPSSGVCSLYNIPSLGVKGTSSVLWSSVNFCSVSQNMHHKAQVASQYWKTNKVVRTWKDDWPPLENFYLWKCLSSGIAIWSFQCGFLYTLNMEVSNTIRWSFILLSQQRDSHHIATFLSLPPSILSDLIFIV